MTVSPPSEPQLRYLSDDWLGAADRALGDLAPLDTDLRIGFRIEGGPDGDTTHQLVLGVAAAYGQVDFTGGQAVIGLRIVRILLDGGNLRLQRLAG